ncbi:Cf DEFNPV ORF107-like protein [Philosamia cynthia ricini nucleopolyhedrovirus virus]|nr:Cf DEFNPV ORF107-like protein [Philosamia cynthia ricini nucleopolyhedrovirus virus]
MATTNVPFADALLQQFKLEYDWNEDLTSLNDFYMYSLEDNQHITPAQKAAVMQELSLRVDAKHEKMENLRDALLTFHRVCIKCKALHAPEYHTYGNLFCRKCGHSLCVPNANELGLDLVMQTENQFKKAIFV